MTSVSVARLMLLPALISTVIIGLAAGSLVAVALRRRYPAGGAERLALD